MKNKSTLLGLVVLAILPFLVLQSCKKSTEMPQPIENLNQEGTISLIGLKSDSGYAYKIGYNLPVSGDTPDSTDRSKLVLMENGVELSQAHSNHKSIRDYGQGQYSHWGNSLYFSTSDNTNPLQNGRRYSYIIKTN